MALHLTVSEHLDALARRLGDVLARPPDDPFVPEVVAVPGDGMRSWLIGSLARSHGAVVNVDFVYPGALVQRALGPAAESPWSIAPLMWAIHQLGRRHHLGVSIDLARARQIADRFDHHLLHRPAMVSAWERGLDIDAAGHPVPEHLRWQPRLWRLLVEHLGEASPAARHAERCARLAGGSLPTDLPPRVAVFGLTALPGPQLDVLRALAAQREVQLFTPVPSLRWWRRVVERSSVELLDPHPRSDDPTAAVVAHPVVATWGRAAREGQLLLAAAIGRSGADHSISAVEPAAGEHADVAVDDAADDVLGFVQRSIRDDVVPDPAARPVVDAADRSFRWHRCHGLARQVEVLRDEVLHLLNERDHTGAPRFEPRDIVVLCPDVAAVAPLVVATFAGDPERGLPAVPVRVSDRSVGQEVPLFAVAELLCAMLDRRARASDVMAVVGAEPVRRKFAFDTARDVETIRTWVDQLRVRWGFDAGSRRAFGVPDALELHTWRAGLDRLLLGAAMSDTPPRFGPGGVVPFAGLERDGVGLAGRFADLVDELDRATTRLSECTDATHWADEMRTALRAICELDDSATWQWARLDRAVERFVGATRLAAGPDPSAHPDIAVADAASIAASFRDALADLPGRTRFGAGEVTVSSLTALRAVPSPVVCLLGLDGDLTSGAAARADDLGATLVAIGDRDIRSELRAQLLDSVLAAQRRLVLVTTGRDVRSNTAVPPAVVVSELAELVDASAVCQTDRGLAAPSAVRIVDHPRQSWSPRNFVPGELVPGTPWGFDPAARDAAASSGRPDGSDGTMLFGRSLPAAPPLTEVDVVLVERALTQPARVLLQHRLGVELTDADALDPVDALPLKLDPLEAWSIRDGLLQAHLAGSDTDGWAAMQRAVGAVPVLGFGDRVLADAEQLVGRLLDATRAHLSTEPPFEHVAVDLHHAGVRVHGSLGAVHHDDHGVSKLVELSVSTLDGRRLARQRLRSWLRLSLAALAFPERRWEAVIIGHESDAKVALHRFRLRSGVSAAATLDIALDVLERSRRTVVPLYPLTTWQLNAGDIGKARGAWSSSHGRADSSDMWVAYVRGGLDLDDLLDEELPDDEQHLRELSPSRLEAWARWVWTSYLEHVDEVTS